MDSETGIRPYRETDWPEIEAIVKEIWTNGVDYLRERKYGGPVAGKPWHAHKLAAFRADIAARPQCWFVTELDGRVAGFCSYQVNAEARIGTVGLNGVRPDLQGRGIGSRQLRFILAELRRQGMAIAEVQTGLNEGHAPARGMYERAGFEPLFDGRWYWLRL